MAKTATAIVSTKEYAETLLDIKKHIQEAQIKATMSVNKELIKVYWYIGKTIAQRQIVNGWGSGIVEKFANDLQKEFPGLGGFSRANIFNMRAFYAAYEKVQQPVGQLEDLPIFNISWGHNMRLLQKLKNNDERFWYAQQAIENGWSRAILETWIASSLYQRKGKAITNFKRTLPAPDSDMANQSLKDPYVFDFLTFNQRINYVHV